MFTWFSNSSFGGAAMREIRNILALVSLFLLAACSPRYAVTQRNPAADFPYRHSDFDYRVAWKTTDVNNAVVIDGILKNVRYPSISSLDVTVFLVGTDGKVRSRATTLPFPQKSQMNEVIPFNEELRKVTLNQGDTFKFVIHYTADVGGPDDAINWNSTFAVDAMTGAKRHKDNLRPEEW